MSIQVLLPNKYKPLMKKLEEIYVLGCLELEFFDFLDIIIFGAKKYSPNNWKQTNGKNSDHKSMHASMFRHLAYSQANIRIDQDSGFDHLLLLACRANFEYYLKKNGIKHIEDK